MDKDQSFIRKFDATIRSFVDVGVMLIIVRVACGLFGQPFNMAAIALSFALVAYLRTQRPLVNEWNKRLGYVPDTKKSVPLVKRLESVVYELNEMGYEDKAEDVQEAIDFIYKVDRTLNEPLTESS